jgi:hypothetical protein
MTPLVCLDEGGHKSSHFRDGKIKTDRNRLWGLSLINLGSRARSQSLNYLPKVLSEKHNVFI